MALNQNTQGLGVAPGKDSEMQTAIRLCSGAINQCHSRVETLSVKLATVLRAAGPTSTGPNPTAPPSSVPVIQQIDTAAEEMRGVVDMLDDLINRLPL